MPMRIQSRGMRARPGAAVVEFAVLLPFLMAVLLFAIDFARILYFTITIESSLEDAALFGSQVFDNQNQQWVGNQQYWQSPSGQVTAENAAGTLDAANLTPALTTSNVVVSSPQTDADGNPVNIVTITYTFSTLVPYPGIPTPVTITRKAQVRIAPATPS
jgi:Flp pilus assembly protein TadG